jgi:hypothetical protein
MQDTIRLYREMASLFATCSGAPELASERNYYQELTTYYRDLAQRLEDGSGVDDLRFPYRPATWGQ